MQTGFRAVEPHLCLVETFLHLNHAFLSPQTYGCMLKELQNLSESKSVVQHSLFWTLSVSQRKIIPSKNFIVFDHKLEDQSSDQDKQVGSVAQAKVLFSQYPELVIG
jgi:hypothetical protein